MLRLLDDGLDEIAAGHHQGTPLRALVTAAVALIALWLVPAALCADWSLLMVAVEGWSWFATRRQFKGQVAGAAARLNHLASHTAISFAWMGLGWLFWVSGSMEGAISAVAIWLTVIFYSQAHAYQSTICFVAGGLGPAAAMLIALPLTPNHLTLNMPLVWCMLTNSV